MLYAPFSRDRAAVPRPMGSVTAAGERFFISTTRDRVLRRVSGTVEVLEDIPSNLPMDRAIREKHGIPVAADEELAAQLVADNRVLLAVTPSKSMPEWSALGVDA